MRRKKYGIQTPTQEDVCDVDSDIMLGSFFDGIIFVSSIVLLSNYSISHVAHGILVDKQKKYERFIAFIFEISTRWRPAFVGMAVFAFSQGAGAQ